MGCQSKMSIFNFDFGGKKFEIQGPPGATEAQARAIFDQQAKTGALVGLKSGDILNAAKQAEGGVAAAVGQVSQALSGVPGLSSGALGTGFSTAGKEFSSALGSATSVVQQTLSGITKSLGSTPVTNGINLADFSKQVPSLTSISSLSGIDVRAAMSQASTLVGQASTQFSDALGVGKFGFDANQLESAGLLKTGTVSSFLTQGVNSLTSVLKSPAVWTGKDGINNLDSLLNNPAVQNLTQQNLMSSGLNAVKQLGIPIDKLNPKALAGVSLNAAKSPADALAWAKGELPADLKSQFDTVAKDASFAVDFADQKINDAIAQLAPPGEAEDTVDRATLDAAVTRLFGNDKIPNLDYGSPVPPPAPLFAENKRLKALTSDQQAKISTLVSQETTAQNVDARIAQYTAIRSELLKLARLYQELQADVKGKPYTDFIDEVNRGLALIQALIEDINIQYIPALKQFKQRGRA
jgi:hypothetical protein